MILTEIFLNIFIAVSDVKGNKRRKVSYDFVSTIDQTGGFINYFTLFAKVITGRVCFLITGYPK